MKAIIVALSLIMLPITLMAQGKMRPVLDSTVTCSYYKGMHQFSENAAEANQILEVFYIVQEMPRAIVKTRDIDGILDEDILMNKQERTIKGTIVFQCVVNCKGKAGDFQIIDCPIETLNIGYQVLDILRAKYSDWKPGRQANTEVDVLVQIKVLVSEGKFSVVAPVV